MRLLPAILILALGAPAAAPTPDDPRAIVLAAERAVSDDSADVVSARWRAALARDSSDRAALLGLATLARMTYDFPTAERLLARLLARRSGTPDQWEVQAHLGLYRVAFAQGDDGRARGFLDSAVTHARRIGDRGGEADAMMGFTSVRGPAAGTLLAALDTLDALLPPGDGRDRAESLCRRGLYTGIGGDTAAIAVIRRGTEMAERVGERRLTGHCLEAYGLVHSVQGHADSVLPIYQRAEVLLRATHDHASLARLESRRSDEFQTRGWLGEAKLALGRVRAEAEISHNRQRLSYAYAGLGMLALRVGDLPTAARRYEQAAALYDSLGQGEGAMISRQNRAEVMEATGDLLAARDAFHGALAEAEEGDDDRERPVGGQCRVRVVGVAVEGLVWVRVDPRQPALVKRQGGGELELALIGDLDGDAEARARGALVGDDAAGDPGGRGAGEHRRALEAVGALLLEERARGLERGGCDRRRLRGVHEQPAFWRTLLKSVGRSRL